MTIPYTYLIGWSSHRKFYYGVRYRAGCSPSDLWITYFTSSRTVARLRVKWGEPDVIQVRRIFKSPRSAYLWETKVLRRITISKPHWLNHTTNQNRPPTLCPGAVLGRPQSVEHKQAISKALKGRRRSPTHNLNHASSVAARSEETKQLMISRMKSAHANRDPEAQAARSNRIRQRRQGSTASEQTRKKMSLSRSGRVQSPETIARRQATKALKAFTIQSWGAPNILGPVFGLHWLRVWHDQCPS